jgi:hypothetical protein
MVSPNCDPTLTISQVIMLLTNLTPDCIKKFPSKSELFWPNMVLQKKILKDFSFRIICKNSSPYYSLN